jgi:D-apionolactonase
VTHVDGSKVDTQFPKHISPSQPIFDIRALAHEVSPGLWVTCRMEGDSGAFVRATTDADALETLARPLAGGELELDAYAVARID